LKKLVTGLALIACCSGCATADARSPAAKTAAVDTQRHAVCAGRMYADRAGRGRSAVNWHVYDYCMAHPD